MRLITLPHKMMVYRRYLFPVVIGLFLLSPTCFTMAKDQQQIITAGPAWERFTNHDGSGLYHDIIKQVFADYTVKHIYVPTVQANSMVSIGRADIKMCATKKIESLVLANHPMYENDFFALFLREKVEQWDGNSSLKGKMVVWREGYYSKIDFSEPVDFTEVRDGDSALKMVISKRADFYIDDLDLIKQSFDKADETFNPEKFGLERVGTRKYFPVFTNNPRGEALRIHYEKEMERLYMTGKLQQIYDRWGFQMPNFKFNDSGK